MSLYSETMSNTPNFELEEPTSCYNCDNDCLGVWLQHIIGSESYE